MVSTIASETLLHGGTPVACSVRVTEPEVISAALKVYIGSMMPGLLKVPVPLVVQLMAL